MNFLLRLKPLLYPFIGIVLCLVYFYKVFVFGLVPIPADFVVGTYYPWLDYKWGFDVGVPVKNPITSDVVSFIYPMQTLAVNLLKQGQIPLWNPYILAGTPLLANFQSAPFTPTNIIYFLTDTLSAWSIQIILQHIFVVLFTYFLLRHWKISKLASLIGGIIFSFSGYNVIWSEWNGHTFASALIPLVILVTDKYFFTNKSYYLIFLSFILSIQVVAGYPQAVLYTLLASGILILMHLYKNLRKKEYVISFKKVFIYTLFILLGFGLAAPQVLPGIELLGYSQRAKETLDATTAFLQPSQTITFIAPDYYGNQSTGNYWGVADYTATTGFVGVAAFSLALMAVFAKKRHSFVFFGSILAITALVLAYQNPISTMLWQSGLLGSQAAVSQRSLVLFNFAVALLASSGLDLLLFDHKKITMKIFAVPFILLFAFGLNTLFNFFDVDKWKLLVAQRNLVLPIFTFVVIVFVSVVLKYFHHFRKLVSFLTLLLLCLITFELFRFGWKYTPFSSRNIVFPSTPVFDFLLSQEKPFRLTATDIIPMNTRMVYGLESLEGYDAIFPVAAAKYIAVSNSGNSNSTPQGRYASVSNNDSHLLDIANTKYFVVVKKDNKGNPSPNGSIGKVDKKKFKVVFEDKTTVILQNLHALPRAMMFYNWETVSDANKQLYTLVDPNFKYSEKLVLDEASNVPGKIGSFEVKYNQYDQNISKLSVSTTESGYLFISDAFYPGWKAFIDNRESQIIKADYMFRAIWVDAGTHELIFKYQPDTFNNGLAVCLASLSILIVLGMISRRKYTRA